MRIFVVSDTHFYHYNVINYCNRPFTDIETMNSHIIEQWNSVVTDNDIVIHLGDFGFGNKDMFTNICSQLNGNKVLIKGNHDYSKGEQFWLDVGFGKVYKQKEVNLYKLLQDIGKEIYGEIGDTNDIILSHFPRPIEDNQLNIHGHIHNVPLDLKLYKQENHICVSVEMTDYKPKDLIELIREWRDKNGRQ